MPELPEVDAIVGVMARHSIGQAILAVEAIREPTGYPYFEDGSPVGHDIKRIYRRGKHALMELDGGKWIDCHNAMTGYWDYEDDPWTFDYVEGARPVGLHVRMRMSLSNGRILRFNDARLFGRLRVVDSGELPRLGPELMETPHGPPGAPIISLRSFAGRMNRERRPVKSLLMDQEFVAGIGNIYANEGCHLAGVDPRRPAKDVHPRQVPVLLEALRCVVAHSIPKVQYQWLKVYRRDLCGSCGQSVVRTKIDGRATFICSECQGET